MLLAWPPVGPPKGTTMAKRSWAGCGCPRGSKKISTKGRGRGWACQSLTKSRTRRGTMLKKFVKARCS
jgi:hypothetical protein